MRTIEKLAVAPQELERFAEWIKAGEHLNFLRTNALADELVLHASATGGSTLFIHTVAVPNRRLRPVDQQDLMRWNCNAFTPIASYVSGGGRATVRVERGLSDTESKTLKGATRLVFARSFDGWKGLDSRYCEVHQEYAHLTNIHWRPEHRAYCRFDKNGDIEPVVSITSPDDGRTSMSLVSFKWEPLEEYLAACNASLVRMFDFTLLPKSGFNGWGTGPEDQIKETADFFYRRKVIPHHAGYVRGVQIIRIRRSRESIFSSMTSSHRNKQYVDFIAYDWLNKCVTQISTDPAAATSYADAGGNAQPFDLSAAFFRPEVLVKYKADPDKYTVSEREIRCRGGWCLRGLDVNEAGQVHAYICDLRDLPYEEQLYWRSFNEEPKAGLSKRAIKNDILGKFEDLETPLEQVLSILHRWRARNATWWKPRDTKLFERVSTPRSGSRHEWANEFVNLDKLIIEGFELKRIQSRLGEAGIQFSEKDKSLALLEKLLKESAESEQGLSALRYVQHVRSKHVHAGDTELSELEQEALSKYGSLSDHFQNICVQVARELEKIEQVMSS